MKMPPEYWNKVDAQQNIGVGLAGILGTADPASTPGVEVGQVQMALSELHSVIESAHSNQQGLEVRLGPILLPLPAYGSETKAANDVKEAPKCELVQAIQQLTDGMRYLLSRQTSVLHAVQL